MASNKLGTLQPALSGSRNMHHYEEHKSSSLSTGNALSFKFILKPWLFQLSCPNEERHARSCFSFIWKIKDYEHSGVPFLFFNLADLILMSDKIHMKCFYPYSGLNLKLFFLYHTFFCRVSEDLVDQTSAFYQIIFSAFDLPTDKSLQYFLQEKWKLTVPPPCLPTSPLSISRKTVIFVGGNIT